MISTKKYVALAVATVGGVIVANESFRSRQVSHELHDLLALESGRDPSFRAQIAERAKGPVAFALPTEQVSLQDIPRLFTLVRGDRHSNDTHVAELTLMSLGAQGRLDSFLPEIKAILEEQKWSKRYAALNIMRSMKTNALPLLPDLIRAASQAGSEDLIHGAARVSLLSTRDALFKLGDQGSNSLPGYNAIAENHARLEFENDMRREFFQETPGCVRAMGSGAAAVLRQMLSREVGPQEKALLEVLLASKESASKDSSTQAQ